MSDLEKVIELSGLSAESIKPLFEEFFNQQGKRIEETTLEDIRAALKEMLLDLMVCERTGRLH
jgi:hypothetical protein